MRVTPSGHARIAGHGARRTSSSFNADRHGRIAEIRFHFLLDLADPGGGYPAAMAGNQAGLLAIWRDAGGDVLGRRRHPNHSVHRWVYSIHNLVHS